MHWLAVLLYAALAALGAAWPQGTLSGSLPEPIATSPASAANASLIGDSNTQYVTIQPLCSAPTLTSLTLQDL